MDNLLIVEVSQPTCDFLNLSIGERIGERLSVTELKVGRLHNAYHIESIEHLSLLDECREVLVRPVTRYQTCRC